MSAPEIVAELWAAGFRMWTDGGLIFIEPATRLTAEQRSRIKSARSSLIDALPAPPTATAEQEAAIRAQLDRIMGQHADYPHALAVALANPGAALRCLSLTSCDRGPLSGER